jgi:hypothetical protein
MRYGLFPLLLLMGACAMPPPEPGVTLPEQAAWRGAGDPTRGAILSSAYVFGQPSTVAGNPAAAAEALGQLEFLAVELATGGRWQGGFDPLVVPMLRNGRAEARAAMGLRPDAAPQSAINAWYVAAAALRAGDRAAAEAALAPVAATPPETLRRLDPLPALPAAAAATSRAQAALMARDSRGRDRWLFP